MAAHSTSPKNAPLGQPSNDLEIALDEMSDYKLVQSIQERICGSEWLAKQIMEEQEDTEKHTGYIFTLDRENVE